MWKQFIGVLLLCGLVVAAVLGGVVGFSWLQARTSSIEPPDMATFQTLSEDNVRGAGAGSGGPRKTRKDGDAQKNGKDQAKVSEKDAAPKKGDDKKPDVTKPGATGAAGTGNDTKDKPAEKKDQPTKDGAVKPSEPAKDADKTEPVKTPEKNNVPPAAEKSDPKPADPAAKKPPEENKKPS